MCGRGLVKLLIHGPKLVGTSNFYTDDVEPNAWDPGVGRERLMPGSGTTGLSKSSRLQLTKAGEEVLNLRRKAPADGKQLLKAGGDENRIINSLNLERDGADDALTHCAPNPYRRVVLTCLEIWGEIFRPRTPEAERMRRRQRDSNKSKGGSGPGNNTKPYYNGQNNISSLQTGALGPGPPPTGFERTKWSARFANQSQGDLALANGDTNFGLDDPVYKSIKCYQS